MKILQVVPSLAIKFGGPSVAVRELCRELVNQGEDVTIFTTDADVSGRIEVDYATPCEIGGVKIFYFPMRRMFNYKLSIPLARALKEKLESFDIVHIHSLFQFPTTIASYYCRVYNKPYIITPHGHLDPFNFRKKPWLKNIYLNLCDLRNINSARVIHFTSEWERRSAINKFSKVPSVVIPIGINLEDYRKLPEPGAFRDKYPLLKDKKIILFFGRIHPKKGLDILAKAFIALSKERDDVYLVIAGPDSENYSSKIKAWLEREGVLARTVFTGMLSGDDKLALFKDSDVFVLSSYTENFALAVVEAMAIGLPVVISNKVNIAPEIKEARAGLVIDPDPGQLFAALKKILQYGRLKEELVNNAKGLVESRFIWEKNVRVLVDLYRSITNK